MIVLFFFQKPANILVMGEGPERGRVKIGIVCYDFFLFPFVFCYYIENWLGKRSYNQDQRLFKNWKGQEFHCAVLFYFLCKVSYLKPKISQLQVLRRRWLSREINCICLLSCPGWHPSCGISWSSWFIVAFKWEGLLEGMGRLLPYVWS